MQPPCSAIARAAADHSRMHLMYVKDAAPAAD